MKNQDKTVFDHEVAIIGTGFAGMAAAIALDRVAISNFVLLEKSDEIGGTWRDNQYPGACCDVPSQLYSYSFELNPNWSKRFSPAQEIHAYQQHVMDKYKIRERVRHGFEVAKMTYTDGGWTLESTTGLQVKARYVISAIGGLHIPHKPAIRGMESFAGKVMHSAEWDKSYDPAGKNIIVVGSAASAVQIIPHLAKVARHISVLQRTPNYFVPRGDRTVSAFSKMLFRRLPFTQRLVRWRQYCFNDFVFHPNFVEKPSFAKRYAHFMVRKHMRRQVADPLLLKKLTPDYQIGCKRLLLSDDYLPAMQRDNVTLVTDSIDHFSVQGLVTADGTSIAADLVVLATGFQTTRPLGNMIVTGPDGRTLEQAWAKTIHAHRSIAVSGFPNLFISYGPNSGLGHSSVIIMIEAQTKLIARLLQHARKTEKPEITVQASVEASYNKEIQKALKNTVWNTGCKSWYMDENGYNFTLWPYTTTRFIREMRTASLQEFNFD